MSNRGPNRFLDEFARLMTDAAGAAQGMRKEVEGVFRAQGERLLNQMDLVQREEFEAVRDMALKARAENEALKKRMSDLEAKVGAGTPTTPVSEPTMGDGPNIPMA
ncbi:accessory factor UbiK family protein [Mangrovicella endophytica]|uniref:accessory factor UbiK family protein n=1 Tax=Mangrovicella endophytica TaxID=2066697 RepID=UPI000C9E5E62|nr:accessory factor UbiK family protein [Mangrovicella endophytica]